MNFKHTLITAFRGIWQHKSRSGLTILGIVIGVASIIIVMALGNGAQSLILNEISSLGAETAVIQPGSGGSGSGEITESLFLRTITQEDYDAIRRRQNVPNLASSMPVVIEPGAVKYRSETFQGTTMGGVASFFIDAFDVRPVQGTMFTESDIDEKARVAMIGAEVKEDLFGNTQAVGETIDIKNTRFRVVGVFPKKGNVGFFNLDQIVLVPHTAAQTYLTGEDHYTEIVVKADSPENVDKMVFDIESTLRETHDIGPNEEDDFNVRTQQGLVDQISTIVSILTSFLAAVVAISLVVGGVGIMNIMLVSVTERTKEIGLRKALGATPRDILRQFLFEAVMLTATGGIVGILVGALVAYGASVVLAQTVIRGWSFVFPVGAAILGVGVSALIGLVFGIYPAYQASKKDPIDALRYE